MKTRMVAGVWLLAGCMGIAGHAWSADLPNLDRGRLLYENHCVVCHTPKVHRRVPTLPIDMKELRQIVSAWAKGEQLGWSDEEITDVVEYLDATQYRFLRK